MAHKNLIDGTAYEVDGGKAMVDGTVYEIDHGVANVDGTAYEVGFAPSTATVTIRLADYYPGNAYVSIDGVKYNSYKIIEVPVGTVAYCYVKAGGKEVDGDIAITLNGNDVMTRVGMSMGAMIGEYYYTVNGNAEIKLYHTKNSREEICHITITEQ